jgi:hypothetical protein
MVESAFVTEEVSLSISTWTGVADFPSNCMVTPGIAAVMVLLALVVWMPSTFRMASWPSCPALSVTLFPAVMLLRELESMLICPAAPPVWLMSESREPLESVMTLAVIPRPAWLMVVARPAMVLLAGSTEIVWDVPPPT